MPVSRLMSTPLALVAALGIAGCGSSVGTRVPTWAGGLPPEAPAPAAVQAVFPDVHDIPPPRPAKLITEQEQARIEAELAAIRTKMNTQAGTLQKERARDSR